MITVKVTQVGSSLGIVLPREVLAHLGIEKGDQIELIETRLGYSIAQKGSAFQRQMTSAEKIMNRYRNTLQKLAE
jgi:putative addiction module antidote